MMGQGFADGIGKSLLLGIIILIIVTFGLGLLTMWGLPKLWIILKPIIHAITV
jgi:hypothetical protein